MVSANERSVQLERVDYSKVWWVGGLAAVAAAVVNAIIYLIASAAGWMPETVLAQPMNQAITIVPVIMSSIMGVVVGTVVYAVIGRFARRPVTVFRIVA